MIARVFRAVFALAVLPALLQAQTSAYGGALSGTTNIRLFTAT